MNKEKQARSEQEVEGPTIENQEENRLFWWWGGKQVLRPEQQLPPYKLGRRDWVSIRLAAGPIYCEGCTDRQPCIGPPWSRLQRPHV